MTPAELVTELQRRGLEVDEDDLTEWRRVRLLPELKKRRRGALGKDYFWVEHDIIERAVLVKKSLDGGHSVAGTLLALWIKGYAVEPEYIRDTWFRLSAAQQKRMDKQLSKAQDPSKAQHPSDAKGHIAIETSRKGLFHLNHKVLSIAFALPILALGIPQAIDSALWNFSGESRDQLGAANPSTANASTVAIGWLELAGNWLYDPRATIRAGVMRLRLVSAPGAADVKQSAMLQRSISDLIRGLQQTPANAVGWAALAAAQLDAGNELNAKDALRASILLGNFDPDLSLWRSALGLRLWAHLDADDREMWGEQVRIAWDHQSNDLLALARANKGPGLIIIRHALSTQPGRLDDFDRALQQK